MSIVDKYNQGVDKLQNKVVKWIISICMGFIGIAGILAVFAGIFM